MTQRAPRYSTFFLWLVLSTFADPRPLVDTLADELAQVFNVACGLLPEVAKDFRIKANSVGAAKALVGRSLIFVISGKLTAGHGNDRERASRRKGLKQRAYVAIYLFQSREYPIVLFDTIGCGVLISARPLGLQRHPRCAAQHIN